MQSKATTIDQYLKELPEERIDVVSKLREIINQNLPSGFEEIMNYGMPAFVVPHSIYPNGYHCNPKLPLPFINYASQKNYIALYHMGIYAQSDLLNWFIKEYPNHCKTKLDMGKYCIRFKKLEHIPYALIGEFVSKMTMEEWISLYEKNIKG